VLGSDRRSLSPTLTLSITLSYGVSVIVSTGHTDKWVISRLLSVWIRSGPARRRPSNLTAVSASIYNTIHTLTLTLALMLTLNLTLIWSYLTNKHHTFNSTAIFTSGARYPRHVPIGYTDDSLECTDLSVRTILTITFT